MFSGGKRAIIPLELERKEAKTMSDDRQVSPVFQLESAQFPNLLADKDFVAYSWTLPFCVM